MNARSGDTARPARADGTLADAADLACRVRQDVLAMAVCAGGAHVAPAYSIADLLAVLYVRHLAVAPDAPRHPARDRLVLSKGHGCAALYAVLANLGFFPRAELASFCSSGSRLGGHPDVNKVPGVEASTGSLGHGLGIAIGMATAAKLTGDARRVVAILGDGECQEGSIWEGALAAAQLELDNLVAVVDHNGLQGMGRVEEIVDLAPLGDKWRSFGWRVFEVDGHDLVTLDVAFSEAFERTGTPTLIVAHTVKGKGVSYMEDAAVWHYRLPNAQELAQACEELGIEDIAQVLA